MEELIYDLEKKQTEFYTNIKHTKWTEEYKNGYTDGYINAFDLAIEIVKINRNINNIREQVYLEKLKKLVDNLYTYTTEISITEFELFCNYEYLEDLIPIRLHRETIHEDFEKEIKKDILYDLLFNPKVIEEQISIDIGTYETNTAEYNHIKEIYKELKDNNINVYIKELEKE